MLSNDSPSGTRDGDYQDTGQSHSFAPNNTSAGRCHPSERELARLESQLERKERELQAVIDQYESALHRQRREYERRLEAAESNHQESAGRLGWLRSLVDRL
jgi:flagellar motility protein MotE (MotC chaperone)